MRKAYG